MNDPVYTKEFNESEIKEDDEFTGVVTERNEQEIKIKIGRNSGEDGRSKYEIIVKIEVSTSRYQGSSFRRSDC